jgi:hypothetical protein
MFLNIMYVFIRHICREVVHGNAQIPAWYPFLNFRVCEMVRE